MILFIGNSTECRLTDSNRNQINGCLGQKSRITKHHKTLRDDEYVHYLDYGIIFLCIWLY